MTKIFLDKPEYRIETTRRYSLTWLLIELLKQDKNKKARVYNGENTASSVKGVGKTGQLQKNQTGLSHIMHKNKFKMD